MSERDRDRDRDRDRVNISSSKGTCYIDTNSPEKKEKGEKRKEQ
jgi:hypothetical protein